MRPRQNAGYLAGGGGSPAQRVFPGLPASTGTSYGGAGPNRLASPTPSRTNCTATVANRMPDTWAMTLARAVRNEVLEEAARTMDETGSTDHSGRIREMKCSGTESA